ncbi:MAG: membrane protein, partial [Chitinophagaceae bacterium]
MRFLFLILFLLSSLTIAARSVPEIPVFTADSLGRTKLDHFWKYASGDDTNRARKDYDDSGWQNMYTGLDMSDSLFRSVFKDGIGWFRMRFVIDSTLVNTPLAISVFHYGASEVYLDGRLLELFGTIKGPDSTIYLNPKNFPIAFVVSETGEHVLAVRYANYAALDNYEKYTAEAGGFYMSIGKANNLFSHKYFQLRNISMVLLILFAIFLAIFMIHMIMYLFNREDKSNLYFSLFSLSIALGFLFPYVGTVSQTPGPELVMRFLGAAIVALSCISLSGFLNELYSSTRWRFYVITALSLLAVIVRFFDFSATVYLVIGVMGLTALEAIVLIIGAMVRRRKGAKIIGVGFLFFTVFIMVVVIATIVFDNIEFDDSTTAGKVVELILAAAVLSIPLSMSVYLAWNFSAINKDLKSQLSQVQVLNARALEQEQEKK